MTLALLVATLSTGSLSDAPHPGWLLAQAPPPNPAVEREVTIKALREELEDLRDQRSSIGYVFPILCIGVGVGLVVLGEVVKTETWLTDTLLISGAVIGGASVLWLIIRIVRTISLSNQIGDKEDQLRQLEDQRLRVSVVPLRGGVFAGLQLAL
jgi:hypothetical protein